MIKRNPITYDIENQYDAIAVGILASISLHHVLLFLMLQLLIITVVMLPISILLPELGAIKESTGELLSFLIAIAIDLLLLIILARDGCKRYANSMEHIVQQYDESIGSISNDIFHGIITERNLETAILITAACSILWCMLIGLHSPASTIAFTIVEGFAFLFMLIYIIIRYLLTREIKSRGLIALILTGVSLWSIISQWSI